MPAGATYEPIATATLGSTATSYTFSSIPQTYTDLVLVTNARVTTGNYGMLIRFNSDSGSNYGNTFLWSNGSSFGSVRNTSTTGVNLFYGGSLSSTNPALTTSHIMNYSNTATRKTTISRDSASDGIDAIASIWLSTSAISSIDILPSGGASFNTGSTFTLYGIAAA